MKSLIFGAALFGTAFSQNSAWSQCGGNGFTGGQTCVSGYSCVYVNDWYSQCQPGTASTSVTSSKSTTFTKSTTASTTKTSTSTAPGSTGTGHFKWFGVDESGAEFGQGNLPGVYGTDFIFPATSSIDVSVTKAECFS
jgi:endoglucanase